VLTYRTKYDNVHRIRVTAELKRLLDLAVNPSEPFVVQLPTAPHGRHGKPVPVARTQNGLLNAYKKLRRGLGITRKMTPHDLRRTTARNIYSLSRDLRVVQAFLAHSDLASTTWYLQDDLVDVPLETLELAKLNPTTEVIQ